MTGNSGLEIIEKFLDKELGERELGEVGTGWKESENSRNQYSRTRQWIRCSKYRRVSH